MFWFVRQYALSEDGAVTVDWVVLTAAIIGLGLAVLLPIGLAATDTSTGVSAAVSASTVTSSEFFRSN